MNTNITEQIPVLRRDAVRAPWTFVLALALLAPTAFAATQYFSDAGGPLSWDTSTANWGSASGGPFNSPWSSGNTAVFEGTAGTVNVGSGASAPTFGGLGFSVTGYTLSGGTLSFGNNPVLVTNTAAGSLAWTINSVIAGGGAGATITFDGKRSGSSMTLGGANIYNATTTYVQVFSGGFNFNSLAGAGSSSSFGTSGNVSLGGASSTVTMNYTGGAAATDRLWVLGGTGTTTINNNGSGAISFNNTGSLATGPVGARTLALGGTYTASANTFAETINDLGTGANITALRVGGNTWNITGNNSHSGATTLNSSGVLNIGNANALGAGTFTIGGNGSFDNTTGGDLTVANAIALSGGSPTYIGGANNMTINGAATISVANRTITVTARTLTLGGAVGQDVAGRTLTKAGNGNLMLLGGNTYSGGTIINSIGTLLVTNDTGLGSSSAGIAFTASGTLAATNNAAAVNSPVTIGSSRTITVNSGITANFQTPDTNNLTIAAKITGAGNVIRKSSGFALGTVRFSNDANDYTGDFTAGYGNTEFTSVAEQGTASSLGAGAPGTGGQITLGNANSSGTLRYVGAGNSSTHRPLNWTATTASGYTLNASGSGTVQFLGTGTMRSGSGGATGLILRGPNTGANTLAHVINNLNGTTSLTKNDAGTWVLEGANTFSGAVSLVGGVLEANATETPGTSGPLGTSGTISFLGGTLRYSAVNSADYSSRFSTTDNQLYKFDCNGQSVAFATPLTSSGGSLTVGSSTVGGTLTLSAANTYSGSTTVSSGTLLVNGSIDGSGVTVTGGTLGGSGAINSAVSAQAGGTLQPGAGGVNIATLTVNSSLTLAGNTVMLLDRANAQTASLITGISSLTNGGTLTISNVGDPVQAGDIFTLFGAANYSGSFSATNLPGLSGNLVWDLSKLSQDGTISVDQAPVAADTNARTTENQLLVLTNTKLLSLCSDPDGDPLSLISAGPTSTNGGTVSLTGSTIAYLPVTDFVGTDLFSYTISDGRGGSATGSVLVAVTAASAPSPNIVSGPDLLPNGHFHVGFAGIPGYTYTVQYSPNANGPWTTLTALTAGTNGLFDFEDPTEPAPPTRFYRTIYP